MENSEKQYDIIIIGAGPVGLTIANFVGQHGLSVLVLEQRDKLIDYPRGVGMDDECLRVFQAIGLVDDVLPHTSPHQTMIFKTAKGRTFAALKPIIDVFGWPKRNSFIQPLVDQVLLSGLARFENVVVKFNAEALSFIDTGEGVELKCRVTAEEDVVYKASYLVGCDGGRSATRKALNIPFEGKTEPTKWLVVDIENDPLGDANSVLFCDPARPYVSIALPHGIRRLEFMVMRDEKEEDIYSPEGLSKILDSAEIDGSTINIIRSRVYTHNSRLAQSLHKGRVFLAGDAAHLMPVWQGQGYNSGIRDANNLAWKLVAVCKEMCGGKLLETYHEERHRHAKAMIDLSTLVGHVFSPTQKWLAGLRDFTFFILKYIPPVRDYILMMKFKPMPRYKSGAVVPSTGKRANALANDPVGQLFIQPNVRLKTGEIQKIDDVIGPWFSILSWGCDPTIYMSRQARNFWKELNGKTIVALPLTQHRDSLMPRDEASLLVGDEGRALKMWFEERDHSVILLRPDRFVAASCKPHHIDEMIYAFAKAVDYDLSDG